MPFNPMIANLFMRPQQAQQQQQMPNAPAMPAQVPFSAPPPWSGGVPQMGGGGGGFPNAPGMPTLPTQAHFAMPQGMPWRPQPVPAPQFLGPPVQAPPQHPQFLGPPVQAAPQMGYQPTWGQQGGMAQNQQMFANPNDLLIRLQEEFRRRQQMGNMTQPPYGIIR